MLHERTEEAQQLFTDSEECAMFNGADELAAKIAHYLARPEERRRIAEAGHRRCMTSGYSYDDRAAIIVDKARELLARSTIARPLPVAAE